MSNDLEQRVQQYRTFELPGQPMATHMGTSYLINDLWKEVERLRAELDAARRTAEYWKAEHLAGNAELDALKRNNQYCPMCGSGTVPSVPNIESLYKLLEYADESDGAQYGTLSTSLVRDLVNEALVALKQGEE